MSGQSGNKMGEISPFTMMEWLISHGYVMSPRDGMRNVDHDGTLMIHDPSDPDGYCLVGNDISEMIPEAYHHLAN